jgi:two-component system catabolic regulation response regulator CreB
MQRRVLVVEDEPLIAENITYALETDGFEVIVCDTLGAAAPLVGDGSFHLIVLDVGLPDGSGFDFCRDHCLKTGVPVLFLTARGSEIDRVVGLELGGDDYIVKPFSPRELSARVKAVLRRIEHAAGPEARKAEGGAVRRGVFEIDDTAKSIRYHGKALTLSRYEYRLLKVLVERPGRVFSRDELMERAWEEPDASLDRTVDAHIKKLRAKLREIRPEHDPICTHRGMGYSLQAAEPEGRA